MGRQAPVVPRASRRERAAWWVGAVCFCLSVWFGAVLTGAFIYAVVAK